MIKGKKLTKSSIIGLISPSGGTDKEIIDAAIENLLNLGFNVKYTSHLYDRFGYLGGTDKDRVKDLTNMFLDPEVEGIICLRGGYGAIRLLNKLDINIIKNNPKFFCGFSDITVLLNYFAENDLITFHGPVGKSDFSKDNITLDTLRNFMFNDSKNFAYDFSKDTIINNNNFSGKLFGGNLAVICSMIGTPYEINFKNKIVLLEEVNESPYAIDRLLTQLTLSKGFQGCKAVIIGHLTNCTSKNPNNFMPQDIIKSIITPLNIPIIFTEKFGHDYPNLTFPIGALAEYNSSTRKLSLMENVLI